MTQPYHFPDRRRSTFPRWVKWLLACVPLAALVAGAARVTVNAASSVETKAHADSAFVRRGDYLLDRRTDSLRRDGDTAVINRIDRRVSAIYCARVPADHRAGCQ